MNIKYFIFILFIYTVISSNILCAQEKLAIEPVRFNTNEREFAPAYYKNGIVFCGIGDKNEALTYLDYSTGAKMTDLFFIGDEKQNERELFSTNFQTSYHDGPITFSQDGKTAYFTRSLSIEKKLKNNKKEKNRLGVFKATFDGEKWTNIQPCKFNSEEYNVGQPSLSEDGKRLYVVSDKPGGFGQKDIYYAELVNDEFGDLVNMGEEINSSSNEMFPFIYSNNQLYFSSDKDGGNGGLDIYSSIFKNNIWNTSWLTDTLLNTSFDDFAIIFNEQGTEGYFSSNRNGSDDIFKITVSFPEFKDCEEIKNEQLCYEFFEQATLNADSVAMKYQWDFGDGIKEENLEVYHCYEKPGLYIVELNIMDPVIDKVFVNQDVYELEIEEVFQPLIESPDTVGLQTDFTIKVSQGNWQNYFIENYYIDYGDSNIIKNPTLPHRYDSIGTREIRVLISGVDSVSGMIQTNCFYKTINVIGKDYVDSTKVENKVYELLALDGFSLDKKDESDDSYYALELITSAESIKGDSTQLKHYVNVVREMFDVDNNSYSYLLGKTSVPFDLIEKYREAHKHGFEEAEVKQFMTDSNEVLLDDLGLVEIDSTGTMNVVLKNIYFNYESYELTTNSTLELDKLVLYLTKNKNKAEIGAHTDSKGAESYNMSLSEKRAESVVNYLVKKGVDKELLRAKGYGESQPKVPNTFPDGTDNPEGRSLNRRVSVTFLKD